MTYLSKLYSQRRGSENVSPNFVKVSKRLELRFISHVLHTCKIYVCMDTSDLELVFCWKIDLLSLHRLVSLVKFYFNFFSLFDNLTSPQKLY